MRFCPTWTPPRHTRPFHVDSTASPACSRSRKRDLTLIAACLTHNPNPSSTISLCRACRRRNYSPAALKSSPNRLQHLIFRLPPRRFTPLLCYVGRGKVLASPDSSAYLLCLLCCTEGTVANRAPHWFRLQTGIDASCRFIALSLTSSLTPIIACLCVHRIQPTLTADPHLI